MSRSKNAYVVLMALALFVVGFLLGWWLGHLTEPVPPSPTPVEETRPTAPVEEPTHDHDDHEHLPTTGGHAILE